MIERMASFKRSCCSGCWVRGGRGSDSGIGAGVEEGLGEAWGGRHSS